ncbi:MAG: Gfo/Idh/MocA family oxidoreductase [Bacteroidota bacterium]
MDRREVLKKGAVLALGGSLLPSGLLSASPLPHLAADLQCARPSLQNRKLGVALVGLGNYSTRQLAPALLETEHCYLAGIVTGTPQKAKEWSDKYSIPEKNIYNYQTFDRLRDNPDIDIVYVVLPNFMHAEYSIRAFEAGKHVICEKPMGLDADECKRMLAARDKAGKKLQVGYRLYYQPDHLKAVEVGSKGRLGKTKMMESGLGFRMAVPGIWRLDKNKGGGGAIMDLGVYCIQSVRRFAGELPRSVSAQGYNTNPDLFRGIYETVTFQLRYPSGAISNCTTSYNAYVDRFYAACEKGWLEINPSFNAGRVPDLKGSEEWTVDAPVSSYQSMAQMDAFALDIKNDRMVLASGEEGLIDLQIIDAVKQSMARGKEVEIIYGR